MQTIHYLFIFYIMVLSCAFCGDHEKFYDRTKSTIISDFFRALKQKEYPLALRKIERVQKFLPRSLVFHSLSRELEENIAINDAKELLAEKRYSDAFRLLDNVAIAEPTSIHIAAERNKIKRIVRIKEYIGKKPFHTAEKAEDAISKLPIPESVSAASDFYEIWYKKEQQYLEKLRVAEKKRLAQELLEEIDIAYCTSSELFPLVVTQLLALLISDEARADLIDEILNISFPHLGDNHVKSYSDKRILPIIERLGPLSENKNRVVDIVRYVVHRRATDEEKVQLNSTLENQAPSTFSGLLLNTIDKFKDDQFFTGFKNFANLHQSLGQFNGRRIYQEMQSEYLDDQLAPIAPSVHNVLFQLHYLQKFE